MRRGWPALGWQALSGLEVSQHRSCRIYQGWFNIFQDLHPIEAFGVRGHRAAECLAKRHSQFCPDVELADGRAAGEPLTLFSGNTGPSMNDEGHIGGRVDGSDALFVETA